ncbi:hypothetical protein GL325_06970 [Aeromicrobium sp. 636]|uniref:SalK n=1 Tax=Aeromicrobium senzhongii TaxID=2663859 RepID=A0A8I0EVY1_9ACTN|nr:MULTISPECIES: hypothetical protein [Aeromicrobium]MBC9226055.1 hypothetical protein [Aeromicrobium senzhongii]MCQ3998162.1 hypothetical protein [Aeromicrobium sp. 636]
MTSRAMWNAIETLHAGVYFAPDSKARYEAAGLKGYWMGYFASRSAALGTPGPALVVATFHGFAPRLVERAVPDAWRLADRDQVLEARYALARGLLDPISHGAAALAPRVRAVLNGVDWAGKPLAAAHADLPVSDDPVVDFWQAVTALREYRGDCHLAVLTAAGLDGAAANALASGTGWAWFADQRTMRGWTEQEWAQAIAGLVTRGWLNADGTGTETGIAARAQLEDATDRVVAAGLDREATSRLVTLEAELVALADDWAAAHPALAPSRTAHAR